MDYKFILSLLLIELPLLLMSQSDLEIELTKPENLESIRISLSKWRSFKATASLTFEKDGAQTSMYLSSDNLGTLISDIQKILQREAETSKSDLKK